MQVVLPRSRRRKLDTAPGWQMPQTDAVWAGEYRPEAQTLQSVVFSLDWYSPASHHVHTVVGHLGVI